ncbi:MAG: FAD-dependent oxidoreductase [Cyanobacteria bacterium J06642_11]
MATIAIVGAGIAGLTCGKMLQTAGHHVIWVEKSRGVGGRLATRRLGEGAWVNHGLRHWPALEPSLQELTHTLTQQQMLFPWSAQGFLWQGHLRPQSEQLYCTDAGVNAIAKYLARGANIQRQQTVTALLSSAAGWQLQTLDAHQTSHSIAADIVVLAIPAPQASPLVARLDPAAAISLNAVDYSPSLSLMATYGSLPQISHLDHQQGWYITAEHPVITWLSLDSSRPKLRPAIHGVMVQSQADFAASYLQRLDAIDNDDPSKIDHLQQETIRHLFSAVEEIVPGLNQPDSVRLHRWRYSVVNQAHPHQFWQSPWDTLVGCGDWCNPEGTSHLAAAYASGVATAQYVCRVAA